MTQFSERIIDVHCHVGLLGDRWPNWGRLSDRFVKSIAYKGFLAYARIKRPATDEKILEATERVLGEAEVDNVVCLALDEVHDANGNPQPGRTGMYVANEYVLELRRRIGPKVLLGASVHPYREDFEQRVRALGRRGAVLLKWLPSAQDIDLASDPAAKALRTLAKAGPGGGPLPLLLHVGGEYAVPPADRSTSSLDFLSWSKKDALINLLRGPWRWRTPDVERAKENLRAAVGEGAVIILAHCGLPYFWPRAGILEHSDFAAVRDLVGTGRPAGTLGGRFLADVSACCTPFRKDYFPDLRSLPPGSLVFGSDFPTPVFELSADLAEAWRDFRAALKGDFERLLVPQGNLLDVNLRELRAAFGPVHPMFTTFGRLCRQLRLASDQVDARWDPFEPQRGPDRQAAAWQ